MNPSPSHRHLETLSEGDEMYPTWWIMERRVPARLPIVKVPLAATATAG